MPPIDSRIPLQTTTIDPSQGLNALAGAFQYRAREKERAEDKATRASERAEDVGFRNRQMVLQEENAAGNKEVRELQIASAKFQQMKERDQLRIKNTIIASAQLNDFLENDDGPGAETFLQNHRDRILQAKQFFPDLDTNETDQALGMLRAGDIDGLKKITANSIKLGQQLKILEKPEKKEGFTLGEGQNRYDSDGKLIAQVAPKSKLLTPEEEEQQVRLRVAGRPAGASVKVDVNTAEGSFAKEFGKTNAEQFFARRKAAQDAATSLESTTQARTLLSQGVRTGALADFRQGFGKLLQQAGYTANADLNANTDAYVAEAAKRVAMIIKAFGAGTGLSDADREYAQKAAAGQINITEQGLRRILDMNDSASRNVIKLYNKDAATIDPSMSPFPLKVDEPAVSGSELIVGRFKVKVK